MTLTDSQVSTIANALRCAADQYEDDALACNGRLGEQFRQQAVEARELADALEQADTLSLAVAAGVFQ